ncbi:MAG: START domain-containing protein [Sulfurimicrobium sp.]
MLSRVLCLLLLLSLPAHADWDLARERNGISVWTQPQPGFPIHAFRATTIVPSTLNAVVALILDTASAPRWAYRTSRISVLEQDEAKGTFLIQADTDFPWPLSDRDVVLAGQVSQDEKTRVVTIRSRAVQDVVRYPPREGFLRMRDMDGVWQLRPLPGAKVEVSMTGRADPGGAIPAGVINLLIHETPYQTLRRLREVVQEAHYQQARVAGIRELAE